MPDDLLSQSFAAFALYLEQRIDQDGWDCPARFWPVQPVDVEHSGGDDSIAVGFTLGMCSVLEGHPAEALEGMRIPSDAVGAVLCTEGWDYSEAVGERLAAGGTIGFPPSEDPERREVRIVAVLLRDGTLAVVLRRRGEAPMSLPDSGAVDGRVARRLRRAVGLQSFPPPDSPGRLCGRLVASVVLFAAHDLLLAELGNSGQDEELVAVTAGVIGIFLARPVAEVIGLLPPFIKTVLAALGELSCGEVADDTSVGWDELLEAARSGAGALSEEEREFIEWADAGLVWEAIMGFVPADVPHWLDELAAAGVPVEVLGPLKAMSLGER